MTDAFMSVLSGLVSSGLFWPLLKFAIVFGLGMIFYHYLLRFNPTLLQSIVDKANAAADRARSLVDNVKGATQAKTGVTSTTDVNPKP